MAPYPDMATPTPPPPPTPSTRVAAALRESIDAEYPAWRPGAEVFETRSGARYAVDDVCRLLRRPLAAIGVHVVFVPASGGYDDMEVFCTPTGKHISTRRLSEMLSGGLAGHSDEALRAAGTSRATIHALRSYLPTYEGPFTRATRTTNRPPEITLDDVDEVGDFLAEHVTGPIRTAAIFEVYESTIDRSLDRSLGRSRFFRAALASGVVRRTRRGDGQYLVPVYGRSTRP